MTRLACIYNPASGGALSSEEIVGLFAKRNVEIDCLDIRQGLDRLKEKVSNEKYDTIVAVGGDGTVNCTAQIAVSLAVPLGILPAGTLNHFAKDAGIPLKLEEAVQVICNMQPQVVDYATVNGNIFVNNSSIGLYPSTVLGRDNASPWLNKWIAAGIAFMAALTHDNTVRVELEAEGTKRKLHSPMIFVGNNPYDLERVGFTKRAAIDAGKLFVYAVRATRISSLITLAFLNIIGMRRRKSDLTLYTQNPVVLHSSRHDVNVAIDGEVKKLQFPLIYRIHKAGLRLCAPANA